MQPGIELTVDQSSIDALDQIEKSIQAKALRKTMTEIAKPIKKQIKDKAPSDTGRLKRSISYKTTVDRKNNQVITSVGLNYKKSHRDAYVSGVMQEIGTKNMKAQPFIEPVEQNLNIADIESDMISFIEMQINNALAGN